MATGVGAGISTIVDQQLLQIARGRGRLRPVKSPAQLTEVFRSSGLKVTPQRMAIFEALYENSLHPSAEAVYESVQVAMPTISLRTVYSVLAELAELDEILQLDLGTGAARFDPNTDPHHHLVCEVCGTVRDVSVDHPEVRPSPMDSEGFRITGTEIVFRGRCATCAMPVADAPRSSTKPSTTSNRK